MQDTDRCLVERNRHCLARLKGTNPMMTAPELHSNLRMFQGCEVPTRHGLVRNFFFSEGIVYLREHAGAFWLVDAIASHIASPKLRQHMRENEDFARLHFWHLTDNGKGGVTLSAQLDTGETPVVTQEIEYSDFPFDESKMFKLYCGLTMIQNETNPILLFLPSEY